MHTLVIDYFNKMEANETCRFISFIDLKTRLRPVYLKLVEEPTMLPSGVRFTKAPKRFGRISGTIIQTLS